MTRHLARLYADEQAQDLIEYALLTTVIGLASIAVFDVIRGAIAFAYQSWNTSLNSPSLVYPPDP